MSAIAHANYDVEVIAFVPGCGDQILQPGEQCDGLDLGGATCSTLGFASGALSCSGVCTYTTNACVIALPTGSASGRVNTLSPVPEIPSNTYAVVTGFFEPGSLVSIVKDGIVVGVTFSNDSGFWQTTISGLSARNHIFQVIGTAKNGQRVTSSTFVITAVENATVKVSNVTLPPSFTVSQEADTIQISGRSVPGAVVQISLDDTKVSEIVVNTQGEFFATLEAPTTETKNLTVVLIFDGRSVQSPPISVGGTTILPVQSSPCDTAGDSTNDCKVNFLDFSLLLWAYLYNPLLATFDYDNNGKIDLIDFSIMAYHWTG